LRPAIPLVRSRIRILFSRVMQDVGGSLCGLVYAVGTINLGSIRRLKEADYINDFKINAVGAALAVQAALPAFKKNPGRSSVVFFSSVAAAQGFTFHASMGMAKGAVNGLTLSLAAELAPKVRVNAIAPSLTRTPLAQGILGNEATAEKLAKQHALGRLGEPEDAAKLAAFLISPDSDWITGQIIGLDGGRSKLPAS
jgi:NAD(P)-dependent dehydrogenase (short-subunit alcohol dehydrogenase family)